MKQYLDLMRLIRETGNWKADRTGTGTYSIFGHQMRFNLAEGFPLVTTKKCHLKSIIHELLWFLQGDTNIKYLKENGVSIWDEWVKPETAVYKVLTIQERLNSIKSSDKEAIAQVKAFFDKYKGHGDLWAESYALPRETEPSLLNKDGYDFLPDFLDKLGVPDRELTAGDLGPVYGQQWRSWPTNVACGKCNGTGKQLDPIGGISVNKIACSACKGNRNETIDQIANLIEMIKKNPDSRRLIVSAWNPAEVDDMVIPPCHTLFQFYLAPMSAMERWRYAVSTGLLDGNRGRALVDTELNRFLDAEGIPGRRLSCQLYQRKQHCAFVA